MWEKMDKNWWNKKLFFIHFYFPVKKMLKKHKNIFNNKIE